MAADLEAQLSITADADGVEAGVGKAKRSLADLGKTAATAGKDAATGLDRVTVATGRQAKAIDSTVLKMQLAAASVGKTASQMQLLELRQRGASAAQLAAAAAALKTVDSYQKQAVAMERSEAAARRFGGYLGTLSVGAVVALGGLLRSSLDAVDGFNDLADSTGASIENISALDRIARATGGTFDQVSGILLKFNDALRKAAPDNEIGAVFKALNLDIAELKKLDPAEALRRTAMELQKYADDGNKARITQELFGRSVREAAPFLKDLAEAQGLVGTVSRQTAEEVDRFNKEMAKLTANATDYWRSISFDGVQALNKIIDRFNAARESGKSFWEAQSDAYWDWVRNFYGAQPAAPKFQPTFSANDQSAAETARLGRQAQLPSLPDLPGKPEKPKRPKGSTADPLAEGNRYLENLQRQIEKTQELTVYEQALADISQRRLGKLTPELERAILDTARQADAARQSKAALEDMTRAREQATRMQDQADEQALATVDQQIASNQALREEIEILGLSAAARAVVEQARLSSAIALKEEELAMLRNAEASATQISALEREIALLRERQGLLGLKSQKVAAVEAEEESKKFSASVSDDLKRAFSDAFRDTNNPIKAFGDSLYSTVTARVSAAMAESLATSALEFLGLGPAAASGGGGGLLGGVVSSLFGGGKAEGGPVQAGRLYQVNERGPELLDVGGRQFLMMGSQNGRVTPNERLGGPSFNVHQTINVMPGASRSTSMQAASHARRQLEVAARNM